MNKINEQVAYPISTIMNITFEECKYIVFGIYSNDYRFTEKNDELYHCVYIRSIDKERLLDCAIGKVNNEYRFSTEQMLKILKPMVNDTRKSTGKHFNECGYTMKNVLEHFTFRIFAFVKNTKEKNEQELSIYNHLISLNEKLLNGRVGGKNTAEFNKKIGDANTKKIPIKNITTGEIFESCCAAEKKYKDRHICQVLSGERDFASSCEWEYVDNDLNIEPRKRRAERHKIKKDYIYEVTRSVFDITNKVLYRTSSEAEKILNVSSTSINRSCTGERPIVADRRWVFISLKEYEDYLGKEDELYNILEEEERLPKDKEVSLDVNIDFELNSGVQEDLFIYGIITDIPELQTNLKSDILNIDGKWQFIYVGITNDMEHRYAHHKICTEIIDGKYIKDLGLGHFKMIMLDNFTACRKIGILIEQKYTYYISQLGYKLINGKFGNRYTEDVLKTIRQVNKSKNSLHGHSLEEKITQARIMTKRHIRCIETNQIFQSLFEANQFLGHDRSHIVSVLNGDRPTSNGYHWEYADEQGISSSREHYNLCKIGFKRGVPPVLNIDKNIAYPSAKFAAEQNFLKQYQITNVCQNKQKTAINGYDIVSHWKYLTKEEYVKYANEGKAKYPPYEVK